MPFLAKLACGSAGVQPADGVVKSANVCVQLWAWTIDTPQGWTEAAAAGVRVMCTNDPAGALASFQDQHKCVADKCAYGNATHKLPVEA